jgi:hypothetical protein
MQVPSTKMRLLVPSAFPTHPHNLLTIHHLHPHIVRTARPTLVRRSSCARWSAQFPWELAHAWTSNAWVTALQTNALLYKVHDHGFGPTRGHRHVTLTSVLPKPNSYPKVSHRLTVFPHRFRGVTLRFQCLTAVAMPSGM